PSTVVPGNQVTVNASGFAPGESVEIWLHSTPVKLLSTTASADGTISKTVTIPSGTTVGAHKIEVRVATSGSAYAALTVTDSLAVTGFDSTSTTATGVGASILILGGLVMLLVARRRASTDS
ncbi:LPXTG cell wall anchor domain-containing protein, partial [Microbacterium testaceum]|uniref:LPXTG cell wall anchor domain-containing protein n=1 Tax=Microbacterium testaceum TaxID=2033 RepID=UPI000A88E5C6